MRVPFNLSIRKIEREMPAHNSKENVALCVSLIGAISMALLGFGFSIFTKSEAIFLDGVFSLVNVTMGLITLKVSRMVFEPSSNRFHFGKAQTEPLLNTTKGLLYFGVIMAAGYAGVLSILSGGQEMNFSWAILYSVLTAVSCLGIGLYLSKQNEDTPTPLLDVEAKSWMIDAVLCVVVLLAFAGGYILSKTSYAAYVVYIDPALVILMSLFVLPVPYKILKDNLWDLLLGAPNVDIQDGVQQIVQEILKAEPIEDFDLRFAKTGRFIFCDIFVLISTKENYVLSRFDPIRKKIMREIDRQYPEVDLVIELTADRKMYQESIDE